MLCAEWAVLPCMLMTVWSRAATRLLGEASWRGQAAGARDAAVKSHLGGAFQPEEQRLLVCEHVQTGSIALPCTCSTVILCAVWQCREVQSSSAQVCTCKPAACDSWLRGLPLRLHAQQSSLHAILAYTATCTCQLLTLQPPQGPVTSVKHASQCGQVQPACHKHEATGQQLNRSLPHLGRSHAE